MAEKGPKKFSRFMRHFPTTVSTLFDVQCIYISVYLVMRIVRKCNDTDNYFPSRRVDQYLKETNQLSVC